MSAPERQPAWHAGRMVAFDTETTGINPHAARVVTAAVVFHTPGERPQAISWLIDPGVDVPTEASDVHGWTNDRIAETLQGAQAQRTLNGHTHPLTRDGALNEIAAKIATATHAKVPVVAMNLSFDATLLEAEWTRNGIDPLSTRPTGWVGCVDPGVLDKHIDPYRKVKGGCKCGCGAEDKTLSGLCAHYGVLLGDAHTADADAVATLRLVKRMVAAKPALKRLTLTKLHEQQVGWRAAQMDSLRSYFDRAGIEHDGCCGEWPVHVACGPGAAVDEVDGALPGVGGAA